MYVFIIMFLLVCDHLKMGIVAVCLASAQTEHQKELRWQSSFSVLPVFSWRCFVVTLPVLLTQITECAAEELGKGYLVSCLVDHRTNISDYQCTQYITKMTSIIFSDYRLICGFMDKCREDINVLHCGSVSIGEKVGGKKSCFSRRKKNITCLTAVCQVAEWIQRVFILLSQAEPHKKTCSYYGTSRRHNYNSK